MPIGPVIRYGCNALHPLYKDLNSLQLPVALKPSTVYPHGTILGEISGASAVYALFLGGATGGTFSVTVDGQTVTAAYNVGASGLATALQALPAIGTGNVGVTGTTTLTITFAGALANTPVTATGVVSTLTGATNPTFTLSTAGVTATGTFGPYAHGNSDGSQKPKCLLCMDCATDAYGNIYEGSLVSGASEWGQISYTTPAYFAGNFRISDLVGYDTGNTLADAAAGFSNWQLLQGSQSNPGILTIGGPA